MVKQKKYWVKKVQTTSNAMDLESGVFTRSPKEIAKSLKRSVFASDRTKGTKFQSAMSMLNYYINRAGKKLPAQDKKRLEQAKIELRKSYIIVQTLRACRPPMHDNLNDLLEIKLLLYHQYGHSANPRTGYFLHKHAL